VDLVNSRNSPTSYSLYFWGQREILLLALTGVTIILDALQNKKKGDETHAGTCLNIKFEVLFDSAITKPTSDLWVFWHRRVSTTLSNPRPAVPAQPKIPMPLNPTTT